MDIYTIELIGWFVLMVFLIFFFRGMTRKIKNIEDAQSKNSLFTLMLLVGIPLLMFEIVAPIMILMGDKAMPVVYKYVFGAEILVILIYFFSTQRSKKNLQEKHLRENLKSKNNLN
jgi:amino acid permease